MPNPLAREVLLPPVIRANLEREETVDSHIKAASALAKALHALDARLEIVFVKPGSPPGHDTVPGRWHVRRRNDPPAPDTYYPITTENGGYREPDSGVLTEMQRMDMQRGYDPVAEEDKRRKAREREAELKKEQIKDEFLADYSAAKRVPGEDVHRRNWGKG